MSDTDTEMSRLVRDDPAHTEPVDLDRLMRNGLAARRRRTALAAAAGVLAVGVIVTPLAVVVAEQRHDGAGPAGTNRATTSPGTSGATKAARGERPRVACGVQVCALPGESDPGMPERGELIGSTLEMGTFEGSEEVVYAVETKGYDTSKGKPADHPVQVISTGIVVDGQLRRTVWGFQPNEDPPSGSDLHVYGGERTKGPDGTPHYGVFGYIEGDHPEITVTGGAEGTRDVLGVSSEVLPGYTVFYDSGVWEDSWSRTAGLVFAVPDGPTCDLETCGTNG